VYIGGLPYGVREKDLERFFKGYGRIRDILMKNGYGFVEFDDYRDADDAVYELNGKDLMGERVLVERARGVPRDGRDGGSGGGRDGGGSRGRFSARGGDGRRGQPRGSDKQRYGPPTRTEYRLIVENLSSRVSWQDLKDFMRKAGEVTYADAHKQRRNEGVVEFASYSDMKAAMDKLDDSDLNGRRIKLVEDRGRGRGKRSSSSRSRSNSRSRSRSPRRRESRSRSKSRSKSASKSRSRSKSVERERRKSKSKDGSRSPGKAKKMSKSPSRSRSRSKSAEKSRSRSVSKERRDSRSRSRSRSKSADRNGDRSPGSDAQDD